MKHFTKYIFLFKTTSKSNFFLKGCSNYLLPTCDPDRNPHQLKSSQPSKNLINSLIFIFKKIK